MYPAQQDDPSQEEEARKLNNNPEAASLRGLWSDPDFLNKTGTAEFNSQLKRTQFADFHGHGWMFRQIFKRDREGNLLDSKNAIVPPDDPDRFKKAVHLNDIHLEKGMHCIDCHFRQDSHGNGILYNEPRAAIEINCVDCHGSITEKGWPDAAPGGKATQILTSGPAAGESVSPAGKYEEKAGLNLSTIVVPWLSADGSRVRLFEKIRKDKEVRKDASGKDVTLNKGDIIQNSMVEPGVWWRVKQTIDTVTEGNRDYNWKSHYAKTVHLDDKGQITWGNTKDPNIAHADSKMTCFAC